LNIGKPIQIIFFIILALLISSFLLLIDHVSPIAGIAELISSGFLTHYGLMATLNDTIPLLIVAVAIIIPFVAKFWNIGGQGQYIFGSIFATWIGLELAGSLPVALLITVAIIFAFIGGALWAIPPTLMKIYFGTNEIITTLMMNFIAVYFLDYMTIGPMEGALAKITHVPSSAPIPTPDLLPHIGGVSTGIFLALAIAIIIFLLLRYTNFGYELKLIGSSVDAAKYSGASLRRDLLLSMVLSGGIAGIAGMIQVFGITTVLLPQVFSDITTSFGYVGIPVALVASLNPLITIISAFFFSGILNGAYAMEISFGIPIDLVITIYGLMMFFAVIGVMINLGKIFRRPRAK
jgi:simple sugar transport system permease protein